MPINNPAGSSSIVLLAETVVGAGGAASVSITGLPTGYKKIEIEAYIITDGAATGIVFRINNDSTADHYKVQEHAGAGAVGSDAYTSSTLIALATHASTKPGGFHFVIENTTAARRKFLHYEAGTTLATGPQSQHGIGTFEGTSEVSRFDFTPSVGNLAEGCAFRVWGYK